MKKILSLCILALISVGVVLACVKKNTPITNNPSPLTIIVMDTTQALLPNAEVKCGKIVLKTSFDGKVVLEPEQLEGAKRLVIDADGFAKQEVSLSDMSSTLIVALTPKMEKGRKHHDDDMYYGTIRAYGKPSLRTTKAEKESMVYADAYPMEEEDYAYYALPESAEDVVVTGYGMPGVTKETTYKEVSVTNNISAGKLTAGEVNDFAKWYFWPTVIDSTHKAFVDTWKLAPRERYTVQVMNKNGFPVVNYPVNLTDLQGNTLFQALTDNTGKAELWAGLIKENSKNIKVKLPEERIVVDEPCEASEGVDVLFVFDATGSMADELRYLQAEMKDVIARAKEATGGLGIRTGAVVYRDHGDEYITRISRLTENIETTKAFIDKQEANGGGDFPEAIPEALMAALNSAGWDAEARARIAFLILDAPCHEDSTTLALLHDQILNATAQGIRIVPVVCSSMDEAGEYLMRAIALTTNGTSFFLTDDSGIGHTHLKPTTDNLKVEHLNDMLVRTIVEFSAMPDCVEPDEQMIDDELTDFIPNPFNAKDLEEDPTIPHGKGVVYLMDITGKLVGVFTEDTVFSGLPIGVYFVKAFYDGQWHTRKVLIK